MAEQSPMLRVRCDRSGGGWLCHVTVGDDPAATAHEVVVTDEDLSRLAPDADVQALVEASFRFLLEREPRESILRRFELPVIGRYFPEYEAEIRRGL
jgi:hypothetical protein